MMFKIKKTARGIVQRCVILSLIILISVSMNSIVQGFATPAYTTLPRLYVCNEERNGFNNCQRDNERSIALKAVYFTSSTTCSCKATGRIRKSTSSTRLYNGADDNESSSPYWFAKIKTPSSSDTSESLPKQDLPVEDTIPKETPPPSSSDTSQSLPKQDRPTDGTPISPLQPLQPLQPQQSMPPSPSANSHSEAAATSWTDLQPKTTTRSNLQPATGGGFMPIFGVVPEMKPAPPTPTPSYQETFAKPPSNQRPAGVSTRTRTEKRTKPMGASDQEKELSQPPYRETSAKPQSNQRSKPVRVSTQTEKRSKPKGASDQEKELSIANIASEPMQSGPKPAPFAPPPEISSPPLVSNDSPSQGSVVPRTIKVQEIDEDDEEYDDNSVSPIILEYLSKDDETGDAYMQTIVFPFRVDPNVRPEEQLGRENDAPMFTPAVKADIYKVLRSPNDPKAGGQAPKASSSPFAATLLAKIDEGTYAFCDRSLYESMEEHQQNAVESTTSKQWDILAKYTPLDDDQMLQAVSCIGQTSPNSLAITKAFEAYLSQKAWAWGDYQALAFSVEFLIAFGNELSSRLDINHRIRSRKLSDQELTILSEPPFCNYVQPEAMRTFQNQWTTEEE